MKRILKRSDFIFFFALLFVIGISFFTFKLLTNAQKWTDMPYNGHLSSTGLAKAGTITDRYGNILAQSIDGERIYSQDESIRKATLHAVGDDSTNISTAVQSIYRSQITGYSYLFGLGLPDKLSISKDIELTLDSQACSTAYNALNGYNGAVVVFDYETGDIICSVSAPTYDSANPPEIDDEDTEYEGVYLDRTISASYTPGSTFKLVTLTAALENIDGVEDRIFHCEGSEKIGGDEITCMEVHGDITLKQAVAHSCNIVFAQLACELGKDIMTETSSRLGMTQSYSIDGNPTKEGHYDVSDANENQLAWSGVGQYTNEVTPMNMAILSGAIARGGEAVIPHMIKSSSLIDFSAILSTGKSMTDSYTAKKIGEMMRYTVSDYYGDYNFPSLKVCAKTGTAEVGNDKEAHGWITGYTLDKDCPLAFACIVENGGLGFYSAGQVISQTLEVIASNYRAMQQ